MPNKLTTLPAEIGKLSNLTTLNLGIGWSENKNQLTYLPLEIGNLTNLTSLDLSGNEGLDIASLCNAFANFPKEFMINSSNSNDSVLKIILPQFSILPPEMGKLTNLTILDLRGNDNLNITSVFEAFANYPRKISLLNREKWGNVDKNTLFIILPKIVFLPSEIGKLTNLTELDLRESDSLNIASVWDAFVNFPRNISIATQQSTNTSDVNALKIMLPGLTSFPVEITKLNNLIELTIRNRDTIMLVDVNTGELIPQIICDENPIILPSEIKNLTNLTTLNLSGNVTNLPAEIGNLQNLTRLDLFDNKLTVLPSEIGKLQNLTGLYLSDNQLTSLPVEIGKLQNLTILDVSNNHLTTLPAEIGTLQNLTEFYLVSNQLTVLPTEIGKLQNLTSLDLSFNQLTSLPVEMVKLINLKKLNLTANLIKESDIEKLKQQLPNCEIVFQTDYEYYFEQENDDKVIECYKQRVAKNEVFDNEDKLLFAETFNYRAIAYHKNNMPDTAILYFQKAIELQPDFFMGWSNLGFMYLEKKEYEKAIYHYQKALAIDSVSNYAANVWGWIATAYLYTQQFAQSEYAAKKSLSMETSDKYANLSLALAYLFQGKYEMAKEIFLKMKNVQVSYTETGEQATLRQLQTMQDAGVIPVEYLPDVEKIRALMNE